MRTGYGDSINGNAGPSVVCHILQSANGKISGPFFGLGSTLGLLGEYNRIGQCLDANAVAYGSVTAKPIFGLGDYAIHGNRPAPQRRDDLRKDGGDARYVLILDPSATLRFVGGKACGHGMAGAHFVVLSGPTTPADYLDHLDGADVMHVQCGEGTFNLADGLVRLRAQLGIERVVLCGGGVTNATFASAGLIDELSLVVAPSLEFASGATGLFGPQGSVWPSHPQDFALADMERVGTDGVWLHYVRR